MRSPRGVLIQTASWLVTMSLVCVGWVLFRSRTFGDALAVLGNVFGGSGYPAPAESSFVTLLGYCAPLIAVEIYQRASGRLEVLTAGPFLVRYTAAMSLVLTLIAFSAPGGREFIYFDF